MKSVEFSEEQLQNLGEIALELFQDEQDPRSTAYIRVLKRPQIHWFRICLFALLPIVLLASLALLMIHWGISTTFCIIAAVMAWLIYVLLIMKRGVICFIKIYQRYAPESLRNKCRFEPSCSEYMILSIEKYGLLKGVKKGINRLKRCNINGGGFDFP